ncbi:Protein kinase domain [Trinorchestia longiramus]|nr:Protein kinase domain [Trinorchestia longiramus]
MKAIADFNPPPLAQKKIDPSIKITDFSILKVVGRGSYGKVMLCQHKKDKKMVAMKILKKKAVIDHNNIVFLELERKILKMVTDYDHPFLMKMLYCFQDSNNVYFGTEFLSGGDLYHALENDEKMCEERIKLYACEILLGLEFLHEKNIIYRDMKLDNVLIGADGHIKIADFGLCKEHVGPTTYTNTICGTADTIAPEVILGKGYTKDADWWSYGVVLYELYENEEPFTGATDEEIMSTVTKKSVNFSVTPEIAQDLISKLLNKDPEKRIGHGKADGKEIRAHKYFSGISWDDVFYKKIIPPVIPPKKFETNFDQVYTEEPIIITPSPSVNEYDKFFINFK